MLTLKLLAYFIVLVHSHCHTKQMLHLNNNLSTSFVSGSNNLQESMKVSYKKDDQKVIAILGLFELMRKINDSEYQSDLEGLSELEAAQIAVDQVNRAKVLGEYTLKLYANDTKCDPGVAVDTFFHAIFSRKVKAPILVGSVCSDVTASLANIVPYWNMVQVSHGASSPVLHDRKAFPAFFRIVASDTSHNSARLAFIQHFHWHVVTVISQNNKEYTLVVNDLVKMLEQSNITCRGTITFGENDFEDQLQLLKDLDTRIIVGSFSPKVAPKIFCKVYQLGMFGADYVWILRKEEGPQWWTKQEYCPSEHIPATLQGAIFISPYHSSDNDGAVISSRDLRILLDQKGLPMGQYARESHDAIWASALALQKSMFTNFTCANEFNCTKILLEDFDYKRNDIANRIFQEMSQLNFNGVSGPIYFQGADRVGTSAFYQFHDSTLSPIALFSASGAALNFSCVQCVSVVWAGGYVPIAQRYFKFQVITISTSVFIVVTTFAAMAILIAILCLAFNLYFRKLKQIKLSSPRLNNIAVVGCIGVYLGVILLGFDDATNPFPVNFSMLCTAKVYLFAGGFSLAFGSIFAKTYRIHKIFIRSRGGFVKKKYLQDTQLILLVCGLLLIDGLVLTIWVVTDPLDRHLRNLTLQVSETDRSVIYLPQVEVCSCAYLHSWLSLLYGYKGVQLVMGVYMAWETRHVKIPALNDSQYIGISVYGVVITSCIVVVLANVVAERPSVAYITISLMILTTTTSTLALLFFPKVVSVFKRKNMSDPVMAYGLKLECNTRRFLTDDSKEKLFRLEVQNRVYKRELLLLRAEARRLEKLLKLTISPTISTISMELASFKVTQQESETSQPYKPANIEGPSKSEIAYMCLPRRSWPSELTGAISLSKVAPFRSDQHLEAQGSRPSVLDRIRYLIRNKRPEIKRMADSQSTAIETKRKFSLTMCIQAQCQRETNKEIIIDFGLSQGEGILCATREETEFKQKRLLHQSSYPIIVVNLHRSNSGLSKKGESTSSLSKLSDLPSDEKIGIKSRSLDDSCGFQRNFKERY